MPLSISSQERVEKRRKTMLKECVAAQEHFVDLFHLVRNSTPAECVSADESFFADAITQTTRELVEKRDRGLNPEAATEKELKKRTLTNLYNEQPTWLAARFGGGGDPGAVAGVES